MPHFPLIDLALARRLERCEAHANVRCVEAQARLAPSTGATWLDVDGTWAMFAGTESPLTQTFGLGCFGAVSESSLEQLEAFFASRGAHVHHEVSPLADPAHLAVLHRRGYHPLEYTQLLVQPPAAFSAAPADPRLTVEQADTTEVASWVDLAARGWGDEPAVQTFMRSFGPVLATRLDAVSFVASWDGVPIASGQLCLHGGVALLAGASTVPEARGRGAQRALLAARLRYAQEHGCDLAMMGALPGSTSQRNALRQGFRVVYTRTKWALGAA